MSKTTAFLVYNKKINHFVLEGNEHNKNILNQMIFLAWRAEPHYGWADVVGDSTQLLSIQPRERPPGVFPDLDFGSTTLPQSEIPPQDFPPTQ